MLVSQLPITAFPAWARFNGVDILDLNLDEVPEKGLGFIAARNFSGDGNESTGSTEDDSLIMIPRELILSAETVNDYAKVDKNFHQLLETVGGQSTREDIMLYLLAQLVSHQQDLASATRKTAPTPWTEYIRFLPQRISLPSLWSEEERSMLCGTSLEPAVRAKLLALQGEFEQLRELSTALPYWECRLWAAEQVKLDDWILIDAWYRSRCLEMPLSGEVMVPGLDMINHSHNANAFYEESDSGDVTLRIRPRHTVPQGSEITISYGESKPAAEMLFSYGFIDDHAATSGLTVGLDLQQDDPLARAKTHVFGRPPTVQITYEESAIKWNSPFSYLMCLNEEDGLEFRILQDHEGGRQLRAFWHDSDVTDKVDEFDSLIQGHPQEQVFRLRVAATLEVTVDAQLAKITTPAVDEANASNSQASCAPVAAKLRSLEADILRKASASLAEEKLSLLEHPQVVAYLGQMEDGPIEPLAVPSASDEPDFS